MRRWLKPRRLLVVFAAILLIALPVSFFGFPLHAAPEIKISSRTTWLTKPVDKSGYVDYVSAVNARLSKGVTPQNNAVVVLARAIGPKVVEKELRNEFFRKLGIPVPPTHGGYFRTMHEFATDTAPTKADTYYDTLSKQQESCETTPWSRRQNPELARWIKANTEPLKLVIQAVERKRYYVPIIASDDGKDGGLDLFAITGLQVDHVRSISRSLKCRAMLAVHEGGLDDAVRDLLASHKLARLTTQGFSTTELMVGCALDNLTHQTDIALLKSGKLSMEQLQHFQQAVIELPQLPTPAEKINFGERVSRLQVVTYIARQGENGLKPFVDTNGFDNPLARRVLQRHLSRVDWNAVLTRVNREFDKLHSALNHNRYADRERAAQQYVERFPKLRTLKNVVTAGLFNRQRGTELTAELLISELMSSAGNSRRTHDRAETKHRLTIVAIALERFRKNNGRFPTKLADLQPQFLKDVPQDLFAERPFRYVPTAKGYLLYSVGPNGTDNGGAQLGNGTADDISVTFSVPR